MIGCLSIHCRVIIIFVLIWASIAIMARFAASKAYWTINFFVLFMLVIFLFIMFFFENSNSF